MKGLVLKIRELKGDTTRQSNEERLLYLIERLVSNTSKICQQSVDVKIKKRFTKQEQFDREKLLNSRRRCIVCRERFKMRDMHELESKNKFGNSEFMCDPCKKL